MDGETAVSAVQRERPRTAHRRWSVVFGVAGIGLLPWIVVLAVEQPRTAAVGDLSLAAAGAVGAIAVGLVVSAALTLAGSAYLGMAASATGALALCAGFFHLVTGTATDPRAAAFATVLVLGPVALLCLGIAGHEVSRTRPTRTRRAARVLALVLAVAGVAAVLAGVRATGAGFPAQSAHHLKVTWTVLDVAEAAALLTTALALRRRPALVPVAGSVTGVLLFCDVWFNVVGAVGEARTEALQMAVVSIPLGIAALAVAAQEVRQQEVRQQEVRRQEVRRREVGGP